MHFVATTLTKYEKQDEVLNTEMHNNHVNVLQLPPEKLVEPVTVISKIENNNDEDEVIFFIEN